MKQPNSLEVQQLNSGASALACSACFSHLLVGGYIRKETPSLSLSHL
jgi:hypothetical protein